MTTTLPFDLFDPDTWPEPETPAENRQAAEALIDEPECSHPAERLFAWTAYDGTLCIGCVVCGQELHGAITIE